MKPHLEKEGTVMQKISTAELYERQYEIAQIFAKIAMRILKKKKEALAVKNKPGK